MTIVTERDTAVSVLDGARHLGLSTRFVGRSVHHYRTVVSTNSVCWELAARCESEGTVVIADEQTGGRGRSGRSWHSPPGLGVWASILLAPGVPPGRVAPLSIVTAISAAEALGDSTGVRAGIKWPNDIVAGGRKLGGVLVESGETVGDPIETAVVGIGIDVGQEPGDFPPELRETATSVRMLTGEPADRDGILAAFLTQFEDDYRTFVVEGFQSMRERWRGLSTTLGRDIRIESAGTTREGRVVDISPEGALVIEDDGCLVEIWHGDVTLPPLR